MSEKPQAANLVKLSGNFLIAAMIEAPGEALALHEHGGSSLADPHRRAAGRRNGSEG